MSLLVAVVLATAGSSVAADPLGRGTWVVDAEQDTVWLVPARGPAKAHAVGRWPEQLVVAATGTVFVTCREESRLDVIDAEATFHVELPGEPRGLALDEGRQRLWVGLVAARELVGIDTESLEIVDRRSLDRAPRALAVNGQGIAVLFERGGELTIFPRDPKAGMSWSVKLPSFDRHRPWHGYAIAEGGARESFVVAHSLVDTGTQRPATNGHYGGGRTVPVLVAVSVIRDGLANLVTFSTTIDWRGGHTALGVADVTGIAWRDGVVALSSRGTSTLVAALAAPGGVAFVKTASASVGDGASGVAFDSNGVLLTWAAFDRKLTRARYAGGTLADAGSVGVGKSRVPGVVALGRRLFHTASSPRLSAAGLSCATCHVDGREDGLVWRLEQSVRQTPALAGRLKGTEPYTWLGTAHTLEQSIEGTVSRLGGTGLNQTQRRALARYLVEGMRAMPPQRDDELLVTQGRLLFHSERTGCASCHPSDGAFTDGAVHAIGATAVDTPSLIGVALTAPYYHDGSAGSLEELLEKNRDRMGTTSSLSDGERRALAAYLRSL